MRLLAAWLVHLYTASSAAFGLWGVVACFRGEFRLAMLLMMVTLTIDSTDGALARRIDVKRLIPWFDGRRLDDICDYFTYVILPACFLVAADMLPHGAWAGVLALSSAYGFSHEKAKTNDHFFLGWPSYWSVVVPYLYLMRRAPEEVLFWVLALAAAIFVPLKYIYPSRTRVLQPISVLVLGVWMVWFSWLTQQTAPQALWLWLSFALGPGYYMGLSFLLNVPRIRAALTSAS